MAQITKLQHKNSNDLKILFYILLGNRYDLWADFDTPCIYFIENELVKPLEKLIPNYMNMDDITISSGLESNLADCKICRINLDDYPKTNDGILDFINDIKNSKNLADRLRASPRASWVRRKRSIVFSSKTGDEIEIFINNNLKIKSF